MTRILRHLSIQHRSAAVFCGYTIASVLTTGLLLIQAAHPAWNIHLQTDVINNYQQVQTFTETKSWSTIPYKEYQPGALWFFLGIAHLAPSRSFNDFRTTLIAVNLALLGVHGLLYYRLGGHHAALAFFLLLIATGPLLLFRFEPLASLLTLGAYLSLTRRATLPAGLLLGAGAATKLYPLLLLPLLFRTLPPPRARTATPLLVGVLLGVSAALTPYLVTSTVQDITDTLAALNRKPVGLDSPIGNAATLLWTARHRIPPPLNGDFGIQGLAAAATPLPLAAANYLWVVPTGIILVLLLLPRHTRHPDPREPLLLLGTFAAAAKIINPQYLWWFLSFVPLVVGHTRQWPLFWPSAALLAITQWIYPLHYSEFLRWFHSPTSAPWLLQLMIGRNLLVFLVLGLCLAQLLKAKPPAKSREANEQTLAPATTESPA